MTRAELLELLKKARKQLKKYRVPKDEQTVTLSIDTLENALSEQPEVVRCKDCRYGQYCTDAKEQEAIEPNVEKAILDYQSWHYICGDCGGQIDINDNYCRHCGRVVAHLSNKI